MSDFARRFPGLDLDMGGADYVGADLPDDSGAGELSPSDRFAVAMDDLTICHRSVGNPDHCTPERRKVTGCGWPVGDSLKLKNWSNGRG